MTTVAARGCRNDKGIVGLRPHGLTRPTRWLAYGAAALLLLAACRLAAVPLAGYSPAAYLFALGLALGPQLLGHTSYNWSLKHVSPTFVAVVTLGEPVGSALLAWLLFGESFAPLQGAGFALLLGGIYLAARGEGAR